MKVRSLLFVLDKVIQDLTSLLVGDFQLIQQHETHFATDKLVETVGNAFFPYHINVKLVSYRIEFSLSRERIQVLYDKRIAFYDKQNVHMMVLTQTSARDVGQEVPGFHLRMAVGNSI